MQKILKKLWDVITTILVILVFCLAVLLGLPRVIHIQPLVVLSGSMEPAFMTGSLVYVQEIDTNQLEVGDVITFYQDEETVVTHRIIEKVDTAEIPGGVSYRTKGDANEAEDANLVPPKNVIGKAMFAIPYLGYLAQYIQQPPGLYIAIVVGAGLILLMFLPDLFSKEEKEEAEEKLKKQKTVKAAKSLKKQNKASEETVKKQKTASEDSAKKKRTLTEEEKRETIRRRKMREAKECRAKEQMEKEYKDDEIFIINMNDDDVQVKSAAVKRQSQKQTVKKKRPLTPEEKRELARRRKMYEERKRELAKQKIQIKEID